MAENVQLLAGTRRQTAAKRATWYRGGGMAAEAAGRWRVGKLTQYGHGHVIGLSLSRTASTPVVACLDVRHALALRRHEPWHCVDTALPGGRRDHPHNTRAALSSVGTLVDCWYIAQQARGTSQVSRAVPSCRTATSSARCASTA